MSADDWADLDAESRAFLSRTLGTPTPTVPVAPSTAGPLPAAPLPPAAPDSLLSTLVDRARRACASDLHCTVGLRPHVRVDGTLAEMADARPLDAADLERLLADALSPDARRRFETEGDLDLAIDVTLPGGQHDTARTQRLRASVFRQQSKPSIALRLIQPDVPALDALDLPEAVHRLVDLRSGLVLVTGQTGSGKSTTLAALVAELVRRRPAHVITIEDPVEYLLPQGRGLVQQREVGADTASFASALRHALRQDPDVVLLGELRDLETITTALTAAETGHLVLGTLHSSNASGAIHRLVDVFPPDQQTQIRSQLALSLQAICSQQLLPTPGGGRVAATEFLLASSGIRNLIREDKVHQLPGAIETGVADGMHTFDQSLVGLVRSGRLEPTTARAAAHHLDRFSELVHR